MIKRAETKRNFYIYLFLAVLTLAVYLRVCGNDFVNYDDNEYVTDNPHTLSGLNIDSIKWAFEGEVGYWNPLTFLSHTLDCELFGVKAWGHHLVNLLFHIANVLILFAVLKAMTGAVWRSAFVAAIFAVHPLNVESVAWIAERKNILSTMFWFLAIGSYWKYSKMRNVKWYLLALVLFAMGLMSKPMVVTLPFTLLLLDYWPLERLKNLKDWKTIGMLLVEKIPFFALSVISCIITFVGQKSVGIVTKLDTLSFSFRLANSVLSYGKYISKSFWPCDLAVLYPLEKDILIWKVMFSIAILSAISVFVIRYTEKNKYLLVGWVWYLGTLVPVIGLVQVGTQAMADRYAYVPMIGLFIMVGWGAWDLTEKWINRKAILKLLAGSVIIALTILTYMQIGYWRNSITLFERTMAVATKVNDIIIGNLSAAYVEKGEYKKAKRLLEQAIRIKPDFAKSYNSVGIIYDKLGYFPEAMDAFKKAVELNPKDAEAYCNLGVVYSKIGQHEKAVDALEKSAEIDPNDSKTYTNLCLAYSKTSQYEKAVDAGMKAIRIAPTWSVAYYNLSIAYSKMNKYPEAIDALKKTVELNPDDVDAYCNMGVGYLNMGQDKEAIKVFKEAIKIQPNFTLAHFNLGFTYISVGNKQAAMREYEILRGLNVQMAEKLLAEINK